MINQDHRVTEKVLSLNMPVEFDPRGAPLAPCSQILCLRPRSEGGEVHGTDLSPLG